MRRSLIRLCSAAAPVGTGASVGTVTNVSAGQTVSKQLAKPTQSKTLIKPKHILTMSDLRVDAVDVIMHYASECKENPQHYTNVMANRTLLMIFEKPSLRTRLSFETGMTRLGGHAIYYPLDDKAPLGKKESIADTARVCSRYADLIMLRLKSRDMVRKFAQHSTVPVINGLDDWGHPCQILADVQTILEHRRTRSSNPYKRFLLPPVTSLRGVRVVYLGDVANNVTYDWMRFAANVGMHFVAIGPIKAGKEYAPAAIVVNHCNQVNAKTGGTLRIESEITPELLKDADVVMTDSWQSYHITEDRSEIFRPYQVNATLMSAVNPNAIFMHCLPASRGQEVTDEVIDSPQSVVFDQAENRMHAQNGLIRYLSNYNNGN